MGLKMRKGEWMQTYTGLAYYPADPRAAEVCIEDIAHALSMQCRYAGHCRAFFSIAEHSLHVSRQVPKEFALVGLLHDATEAYVVDVPRPLKMMLTNYAELEEANWRAIAEKFSLPVEMPACVKKADNDVLLAEQLAIMGQAPIPENIEGSIAPVAIQCYSPLRAEHEFLKRFESLV